MANRKHVTALYLCRISALGILLVLSSACSRAVPPLPTESRGRVIDQDTNMPIADALVVGKYMGSIAWAGASCDRVEGAVSDDQGWFTIPTDSTGKPPFMEAYSRGYGRGKSPRHAFNGVGGDTGKWQVQIERWDADNRKATLVTTEPSIYRSEREALEASREWKDVYLRRIDGGREEYVVELRRLVGGGICGGGPLTTSGPIGYLEAIYAEQVLVGESQSRLANTRSVIEIAIRDRTRALERPKAQKQ